MVELEMTYNLIIPGRIYFINQKSIYTGTETLEPQKVKLMKSSYPNIIASLLNYGDIEVYPDGMLIELGKMNLQYIDDPINTSDKLNKLLQEESKKT